MSLHKDIKNAYDQVHAPDALVERMKQELYQKDFHEEEADEMTWLVTEAPRMRIGKYFAYVAATLVLCAGCGMAVWNMRDQMGEFHPGSAVNSSYNVPETEDTTEETTQPVNTEKIFE